MSKKTTVLVTGAGGNIGRETVKMLVKRNSKLEIRVFDLDTAKNREFFDRYRENLKVFLGDITMPSSLDEATTGVDVTIHMASIIPPLANYNPELAHNVNVEGTKNLVRKLKEHSPESFILMASSVAVYGDRLLDPYIKVTDPLKPSEGDHYADTKIQMEKIIQESGLRWSIYRLAAIMGMGNHIMGGLMFRMPLEQIMEIATPRDTARAVVNTINHIPQVEGRIFNLGGGIECTTTYRSFLEQNFDIYGIGTLDFPQHAFATKNFHCGYYEDGDDLENILNFRRDTLDDYYKQNKAYITAPQKWATKLTRRLIKSYMLNKSEPYKAWLSQDPEMMSLYFRE